MKEAAIEAGYLTTILSADDYFRDDDGNYNFDPRMLNRAHMSVVTKAFRLMNHAAESKTRIASLLTIPTWNTGNMTQSL